MPKIKNRALIEVVREEDFPSEKSILQRCASLVTGNWQLITETLVLVVCFAVLMAPADVWAGLTSLSAEAKGDSIFKGGQDRLNIVFTVDQETVAAGYSYTVTASRATGESYLIREGTVQANARADSGRVSVNWDGRINNTLLADGTYTIQVELGPSGESLTTTAILDTQPPRISSVFANENASLLLTDEGFINVPIRTLTVVVEAGEGSAIDFGAEQTNVVLKNARGVVQKGSLNYTTQLSFSLGNPLDDRAENGRYTVTITAVDKAGNVARRTTEFTFDNVAPDLTRAAGSSGTISPGAGVSGRLDFVEATLADNLENGLNLSDSTIRLTGPAGEILGRQAFPGKDKVRWVFLTPLLPSEGLHDGGYTIEVVGIDRAGNQSSPVSVPFVYDNLAPRILSLSPTQDGEAFNQIGDTIYHNQPLTQIVASFSDGSAGVGVDFEKNTRIQLSAIGDGNTTELLTGRTFVDRNQRPNHLCFR